MALFDPKFDPLTLLGMAVLNPVVIGVAIYMGQKSDQWQKLVVVGFASAFAGAAAVWLATTVGLLAPRPFGRDAGLFLFSFVYGMLIGGVVYVFKQRAGKSTR